MAYDSRFLPGGYRLRCLDVGLIEPASKLSASAVCDERAKLVRIDSRSGLGLRGLLGALALIALTIAVMPVSAAVKMVSHRAVYGMSLKSSAHGSGISGARGSMIYSFRAGCDGWASETNVKLQLLYAEGDQVSTEWAFASWEARDGKSYQFRTRQARDGQTIEELKGRATRLTADGVGEAKFSSPDGEVIAMPKGTLFPSRHLTDLLEAGSKGVKIFSRTVFDGASLDNPYEINAIVVRRSPLAETATAPALEKIIEASGLSPEQPKHYRMAFFAARASHEKPEFELGVDYRSDGVSRFIRQDFGDFVIDLTLQKIELLTPPKC